MLRLAGALMLVVSLAALAMSTAWSKSKPPPLPSCAGLSSASMAHVLGLGKLTLRSRTSTVEPCSWSTDRRPGHYRALLTISIEPGMKSLYETARAVGIKQAKKEGRVFGDANARTDPWKAAFFLSSIKIGSGPCEPAHTMPEFGPPECSGDPEWAMYNVTGYGTSRRYHRSLQYSIGLGVEHGEAQLSGMLGLERDLFTGAVH
jgi:hypothetical protein